VEDPPPRRAHKTSPPSLDSKYIVAISHHPIDDAPAAVLAFGGEDSAASLPSYRTALNSVWSGEFHAELKAR